MVAGARCSVCAPPWGAQDVGDRRTVWELSPDPRWTLGRPSLGFSYPQPRANPGLGLQSLPGAGPGYQSPLKSRGQDVPSDQFCLPFSGPRPPAVSGHSRQPSPSPAPRPLPLLWILC